METNQNKSANIFVGNPLLYRYARSLFRVEKVSIFFTCYVLGLVLFIGIFNETEPMYYFLMAAEFLALWIVAPHMAGSAIGQEISGKNIDFFRMLPLSPHQKVVGIIFGRNQLVLLFAAINLVIAICLAIVAIDLDHLFNHLVILICGSFFLTNLSTTISLKFLKRAESKSSAQTVLIALVAFWGMSVSLNPAATELMYVDFYFMKLHILIIVAAFALYLGCLNYHCSLRLIARENSPTLSPLAATCWAVGIFIMIFGLFLPYTVKHRFTVNMTVGMYFCVCFIAAYFFVLALKSFDHYWQYSSVLFAKPAKFKTGRLILFSNAAMFFLIFALGVIPAFIISIYGGVKNSIAVELLIIAALTCLFPLMLSELCIILISRYSKIGFAFVAIYITYLLWPHIFISDLNDHQVANVSIFGMMDYIFQKHYRPGNGIFYTYAVYHLVISSVVGIFVLKNYSNIIKARKSHI